jgi:hypothetical protein
VEGGGLSVRDRSTRGSKPLAIDLCPVGASRFSDPSTPRSGTRYVPTRERRNEEAGNALSRSERFAVLQATIGRGRTEGAGAVRSTDRERAAERLEEGSHAEHGNEGQGGAGALIRRTFRILDMMCKEFLAPVTRFRRIEVESTS